jgi:endonuclease YncB( thermonuclease family)
MNWDDAVEFSFEGQCKEAKVLSVYDGDTITVAFPFGGQMFKWNCRLIGVDTPELRTRNLKEKEFGYKVRDFLREKIDGKIVKISCRDFDKYGRLLIELYVDSEPTTVNKWLIDNGYAFAYDGGTKQKWFDEDN